MYGLKQSPRYWNEDISNYFTSLGFIELQSESCVFYRRKENIFTILILYVDDITIACSCEKTLLEIKIKFQLKYKMKDLGTIKQFLGMKISYDQVNGKVEFSQCLYTKSILEEYLLNKNMKRSSPMDQKYDSIWNHEDKSELLPKINNYRQIVGKLIHLCNLTRPDISFTVSVLASKTQNPTITDFNAIQWLLEYLNNTWEYGLNVGGIKTEPIGYVDASYARNNNTGKSQTGYVVKFGDGVVIWKSQSQTTVATSTTEAEYIALHALSIEIEWLRNLFEEIQRPLLNSTLVYEDNYSVIKIATNTTNKRRSKNYNVKYHRIRELINTKVINVQHIPSEKNIADLLTKPLPRFSTQKLRMLCGIKEIKSAMGGKVRSDMIDMAAGQVTRSKTMETMGKYAVLQ